MERLLAESGVNCRRNERTQKRQAQLAQWDKPKKNKHTSEEQQNEKNEKKAYVNNTQKIRAKGTKWLLTYLA